MTAPDPNDAAPQGDQLTDLRAAVADLRDQLECLERQQHHTTEALAGRVFELERHALAETADRARERELVPNGRGGLRMRGR